MPLSASSLTSREEGHEMTVTASHQWLLLQYDYRYHHRPAPNPPSATSPAGLDCPAQSASAGGRELRSKMAFAGVFHPISSGTFGSVMLCERSGGVREVVEVGWGDVSVVVCGGV